MRVSVGREEGIRRASYFTQNVEGEREFKPAILEMIARQTPPDPFAPAGWYINWC